jgi:hypothetical protein
MARYRVALSPFMYQYQVVQFSLIILPSEVHLGGKQTLYQKAGIRRYNKK